MRSPAALVTALGLLSCRVPSGPVTGEAAREADRELTIPDPATARQALIDALSSGKPGRVWTLMGPAPRARFGTEAAFSEWCGRYCAEWLVQVLGSDAPPRLTLRFGQLVLVGDGERFWVDDAPFLPTRRTAEDALLALADTLVRLADDVVLDTAQQVAWSRFATGLRRAVDAGVTVTAGTPLVVSGGRVTLSEAAGQWSVARFELEGAAGR